MITVRITRNIFSGDYECIRIEGPIYASDLKREENIGDATLFRDGKPLDDNEIINDGDFIIAEIIPRGATATLAVLLTLSIFGAVVGIGVTMSMLSSIPSTKKLQTSPSLRGSTNTARKNQMLPILLGRYRIYPDIAALPFSLYKDNDQYLRQLFCFGYRNVSIDQGTIKIGETLLSKYRDYTATENTDELYDARCIESAISLKLSNEGEAEPIERTTASNTWKICIGIMAPSGISGDGEESADVGIRIEYRAAESESWITVAEETLSLNCDRFRKMYEIIPSSPGTYDVRVTRTNTESESASVIDTVYLDVMQSWTLNSTTSSKEPIAEKERFSLLALELKATDQLNGIVDELNAVCTLKARIYSGTGTGSESWKEGDALNPAAAILYLLTDQYANPSPLSDDEIVWDEFEEFYRFCDEHGFECNAYINSEDYSIEDICSYIAESNLAEIRKAGRRIGISIDAAASHYTQLFTPRNAWNFSVQKSFSQDIRYFRIKYIDASLGYEETERTVSLDASGNIVFDAEIPEDESGTEISLLGVTDPTHAAYVGRQRLREISRQKRTFTWTSDVEGILCVPGDVVLIEHSQFSIGLGEGRIKRILKDENGLVNGVELDTILPFEGNKVYSMIIRSGTSISESLTIRSYYEGGRILYFSTTPKYALRVGDLCAVGEQSRETIPVMITSLERDEDSNCKVTAVDYDPAIYEEGEIPPYDPGISKYPDAGDIGTGSHLPDGYIPPSRPGADGGDPRSLFQYSASPYIAPDDAHELLVWGNTVLAWGGTAFMVETGRWSPIIEYPPPAGKPYLWEKYWSYELNDWQIFCRTTLPTPSFEVIFVPMTYPLTSRGWTKGNTRIRATCRRVNSDGDIVWTLPENITWSPVNDRDMSVIDIFIPNNLALSTFTVVCYVEGIDTKDFILSGIKEGQAAPIYGGVVQAGHLPVNTTEGELIFGDHIIVENGDGTRDPYYWDGDRWVFFDGETPRSVAFMILQNVLWDGTSAPATEDTLSAINIFSRNLATNTLFAFYAKIRNLLIGDSGDDFATEIFDYENGKKVSPVFRVRYGGRTVFQIDPATGNVFFGEPNSGLKTAKTGFMYQASDRTIRSTGDNVIIKADGTIEAKDGIFTGRVNATSGTFTGTLNAAKGTITDATITNSTISGVLISGALKTSQSQYGDFTANFYANETYQAENIFSDLYGEGGYAYVWGTEMWFRATCSVIPECAYIKAFTEVAEGGPNKGLPEHFSILFYDRDMKQIMVDDTGLDVKKYTEVLGKDFNGGIQSAYNLTSSNPSKMRTYVYINQDFTINVVFGEDLILNVPFKGLRNLEQGQVYVEPDGTLKVHF